MTDMEALKRYSRRAVVSEQVVSYVIAVSQSTPLPMGPCIAYRSGRRMVLVGYPLGNPTDTKTMERVLDQAMGMRGIETISVIGPARPRQAPPEAVITTDDHYVLPLPVPSLHPKLANLLRRAARDLVLVWEKQLQNDHVKLVQQYLGRNDLQQGTRRIFANLGGYIMRSSTSRLVSARLNDGRLAAFAVGEYASRHTAMFMFCFRDRDLAPPGSADLALSGLVEKARGRGHQRVNLGLGINGGIRFFKRKWGARPFLPCIETTWDVGRTGFWQLWRKMF